MKAEGRKNRGVRIMHALRTLSHVFYTWGCAMENLQFDSKHPVAMNLLSSGTISPSSRLVINFRCSTPISVVKPSLHYVCNFPCHFRSIKILSLCICLSMCIWIYRAQSTIGRDMATSQSIRKGTWRSKISRSRPQNDWDSFSHPQQAFPRM
jgi:hypothetical protein